MVILPFSSLFFGVVYKFPFARPSSRVPTFPHQHLGNFSLSLPRFRIPVATSCTLHLSNGNLAEDTSSLVHFAIFEIELAMD